MEDYTKMDMKNVLILSSGSAVIIYPSNSRVTSVYCLVVVDGNTFIGMAKWKCTVIAGCTI